MSISVIKRDNKSVRQIIDCLAESDVKSLAVMYAGEDGEYSVKFSDDLTNSDLISLFFRAALASAMLEIE